MRIPITRTALLSICLCFLNGCDPRQATVTAFNFERLQHDGTPYTGPVDLTQPGWTCVRDLNTGLIWEIKSFTTGLRSRDNTYTWFAPNNEQTDQLDYRGTADGGVCSGSECDISDYVQAVNRDGLCGAQDWRMPTKDEFATISDPRKPLKKPTIDVQYFPDTHAGEYWTGNDYAFQHDSAWIWNFEFAHDRVDWKKEAKYVRLVRGELNLNRQ